MSRKKLYLMVETSDTDYQASSFYDFFMIFIIVLSVIPLAFKRDYYVFSVIDKVCVIIFIFDYLIRWLTADFKYNEKTIKSFLRYPFSFMAIIDVLSILPSLTVLNSGFKILRIMRMFRAMRVLRVIKTVRYSKNIQIIVSVFKKSKEPLFAVGTLALAYILISALVIMNVEPNSFNSFFDAIYWATVSLTTMGYGDIYPITNIGRFFTMISSIFGIAIVALPSGIITAGYIKEIEEKKEDKDKNEK